LNNGTLDVQVRFVSGEKEALKSFQARTLTDLKAMVRRYAEELAEKEALETSLLVGEIDTTPNAVVPLTQAEIDFQAWLEKYRRWVQVKTTLIDTGVIASNNAKAVALLNEVKAGLKVEYVDRL
jgi:hypothetical protein